jgi:hypothetical protein
MTLTLSDDSSKRKQRQPRSMERTHGHEGGATGMSRSPMFQLEYI